MTTEILSEPLWGITLTVGAYALAQKLHARYAWINAFLLTVAILFCLLLPGPLLAPATLGSLETWLKGYKVGGDFITLLLGPATVALAIPLYKNLTHIRQHVWPILAAIFVGAITAIASSFACVKLLHGNDDILKVMLPKSVTTPIAVEIVAQLHHSHGLDALAATLVCLTGLMGALVGPRFLHLIGLRHELPIGLAMGTAAHGIGTASSLHHSELRGMAAGLALALNGLLTSILMIPLYSYFPK